MGGRRAAPRLERASRKGTSINNLREFRERFHTCVPRRADALFELTDAALTAGSVPSPVYLPETHTRPPAGLGQPLG
jgi:hypothetical protein